MFQPNLAGRVICAAVLLLSVWRLSTADDQNPITDPTPAPAIEPAAADPIEPAEGDATDPPANKDAEPPKDNAVDPAEKKPAKEGGLSAEQFQQQFWKYLQKGPAAYDEWAPLPGKKAELTVGKSPHGALVRTFANRLARSNPAKMPSGAILIKENYDDQRTLTAVTVMYRTSGYDAAAGDWFWIKYLPDGSVAKNDNGLAIAGKVKSCSECHAGAKDDDFVFSNDPATE